MYNKFFGVLIMESIVEVYNRFKDNHRNDNGGLNLYPEFDKDLERLVAYLGDEFEIITSDLGIDCAWRAVE